MGWKSVRDHYRIAHIVSVRDGQICIGSPYIPNIIVIDASGDIVKRYGHGDEDLERYQREMDADRAFLARLALQEDAFDATVPVFTWGHDSLVIEKRAEALGYPNPTTNGEIQRDNTHFATRIEAERAALRNAQAGIEGYGRSKKQAEDEVAHYGALVKEFEEAARQLSAAIAAYEQGNQGAPADGAVQA